MAELKLFAVTVSEEWTAEADLLVLAESLEDAKEAAEADVDFDHFDTESNGRYSHGRVLKAPELADMTVERLRKPEGLLAQDSKGHFMDYSPSEFLALLDPEALRRAALAAREANNGQIALLEG